MCTPHSLPGQNDFAPFSNVVFSNDFQSHIWIPSELYLSASSSEEEEEEGERGRGGRVREEAGRQRSHTDNGFY